MTALKRSICFLALISATTAMAQEAEYGLTLPITLGAGGMFTRRWQPDSPNAGSFEAGFRSTLYPSLKLGQHWYIAASVELNSSPYSPFQAHSANNRFGAWLTQGFLAYTRGSEKKSLTIKGGQLASAFGSFPTRYDDMRNPLIDTPLTYGYPDYGISPISLHGLPGIEADVSLGRWDARLQLTNSPPARPEKLWSGDQHPNWTAGAGYTIRQGFRIGASAYRGPRPAGEFKLPTEDSIQPPFHAVGIDGQWSRGRWTLNGEWQRFYYLYPGYAKTPVVKYGYVEAKVVLSPRLYLAARFGKDAFGRFQAPGMPAPNIFAPDLRASELVVGYRINRAQLFKVGYEWMHHADTPGTVNNILAVQFVTSIDALSKAFH